MVFSFLSSITLGLVLIVQTSDAVSVRADNHTQIQWAPCNPAEINSTLLSCSFFEVPLDYHDPSAGKAKLALVKANATEERLGTVFLNPGGPGGSGLQAVNENTALLLSLTGGRYDVVSWDPRGVGLTTPGEVVCFDSVDEYDALFRGTVELTGIEMTGKFTNPSDIHALLAQASIMQHNYDETGRICLQSASGKLSKYMGTAATARDLAAIADAIEGPGSLVNYIGISYGTLLGSWFINMFPQRVGRVILDAVFDPGFFATQELSLKWSHQLTSADNIYKGLVTGCALAGPEGCAVASAGQTPAEVNEVIQDLLKTAHDATRANASVSMTSGEIRTALYPEMYFPNDWSNLVNEVYPNVRDIVMQESQQNISIFSRDFKRRNAFTLRKRQSDDVIQFSTRAILCGDSIHSHHTTMADVFHAAISASGNVSAMFGAQWPSVFSACSSWPIRAVERYQGPFNKTLANNILVIGNTFDPVTPFPGAQAVADLLGDQAALVRLNTFGHTFLAAPSACILGHMQAYLLNGTLPEGQNTVCEVDASFEVFKGVSIPDIMANLPSFDV